MISAQPFVDPEAARLLEALRASGEPPLETLPPLEARRIADERVAANKLQADAMHAVHNFDLDGPGGRLRVRLYRPSPQARLPLILFFHGGGFMVGNLQTHDSLCRRLAASTGAAVLATEYRLAPEHPFPAAPLDCLFAARWALSHTDELDVHPQRVALVGESSGGHLSAIVAQTLAREKGISPRLQVLIYPTLDIPRDTPSYRAYAEGFFFTRAKADYFFRHYIGTADLDDPLLSPLRVPNLRGVCPALILTAGLDPLLSEAESYAARLREAGVSVRYRCFEGWPHGFLFWADTTASKTALAEVTAALLVAFTERGV